MGQEPNRRAGEQPLASLDRAELTFPNIQIASYLNLIDTNTPGRRYDVTPIFSDPRAFTALIVDEWIETGSQVEAAATLIERQGTQVAGIISIAIDNSSGVKSLRERYSLFSLFEDP